MSFWRLEKLHSSETNRYVNTFLKTIKNSQTDNLPIIPMY